MNFSLIQNVSLNIKSKPLQAQYNSIKKVKQNYMFYFFAQVGKRGEGIKTYSWVQTCKHCFSRTIVHETRYD